jgi:serine/threonine protein phosphatase PrpC
LRGGKLDQLSEDHSLVDEVTIGQTSDGRNLANVITRAVGADDEMFLDIDVFELEIGDRYLLCSDGLSRELTNEGIAGILSAGAPEDVVLQLIDRALENGGADNVTVVVADFVTESIP